MLRNALPPRSVRAIGTRINGSLKLGTFVAAQSFLGVALRTQCVSAMLTIGSDGSRLSVHDDERTPSAKGETCVPTIGDLVAERAT